MKSMIKSSCLCVFLFYLVGCQSSALSPKICKEGPFIASYSVENQQICLSIANIGSNDVLLEIPKSGLLYRVKGSTPDGRSVSWENGRVIGITFSRFRVIRPSPSLNIQTHESSFLMEIPLKEEINNIQRVELVFNYVKIPDLRLVGSLSDLEYLLNRNSQRCEAVLVESEASSGPGSD
jgi:hypothetical protein